MSAADILLRVLVGAFLLPHGLVKLRGLFGADIGPDINAFEKCGLRPSRLWIYTVGLVQLAGGLALVAGFYTGPVAVIEAALLFGMAATWTRRKGWFWHRGGMEYSIFWALAAMIVAVQAGA